MTYIAIEKDMIEAQDAYTRAVISERNALRAELAAIKVLVTKMHSAKGRYHTQLACCDLYDAVGIPNERPTK